MSNPLFLKDKWKLLSIGLMILLATGFVAPQAFAAGAETVLSIVEKIQSEITTKGYGLKAIQNNLSAKANQSSVDSLQVTENAIKAKTDNLPTDPATFSPIIRLLRCILCSISF